MSNRIVALSFVLVLAGALTVGCAGGAPQSPVSPSLGSVPAPPVPTPAAPATAPLASIVLEDAFAIGGPMLRCQWNGCEPHPENGYGYEARFLVREVSGRSAAIIKSIVVRNPNSRPFSTSDQASGQACWRDDVRVPPGGRLDTFYTDDGAAWLSYCYVGIGTTSETNLLEVEVQFVDDQGNAGSASTTVTRFRAFDYPRLM